MLDEEEKQLEKSLAELTQANEELEKDNEDHKKKIAMCIQRIEINNLLKSIDKEELQVLTAGNVNMHQMLENLVYKWNFIKERGLMDET